MPVISFTGSTAAGRSAAEPAGRLLKRTHLELGGNSALIVLDDADLEPAVSAAAFGSFMHQGQIRMTTADRRASARPSGSRRASCTSTTRPSPATP